MQPKNQTELHYLLCCKAREWLYQHNYQLVAREVWQFFSPGYTENIKKNGNRRDIVDVAGVKFIKKWESNVGYKTVDHKCATIEAKASIEDFKAGYCRHDYGAEYIITPQGMLTAEMIPKGIGLLELTPKGVFCVKPARHKGKQFSDMLLPWICARATSELLKITCPEHKDMFEKAKIINGIK
ncbi:MAG: hypothetical protein WC725_04785 [Patescibacteria group bacterium]|jgi:hypothetical protein